MTTTIIKKMTPTERFNLPYTKFISLMYDLRDEYFSKSEPMRKKDYKGEYYPFVPIMVHKLCGILNDYSPRSFTDIGCGIGNTMALAKYLGASQVCGVEYVEAYAKEAEKLFGFKRGQEITVGDAFDYVPPKYSFIYMFHPIYDRRLMDKLYTHIINVGDYQQYLCEMLPSSQIFHGLPKKHEACVEKLYTLREKINDADFMVSLWEQRCPTS